MKTWLKRTLIGIVGASALFGTFAALSQHGPHRWGWHTMSEADAVKLKTRLVEKAGSHLDLDAVQIGKLGIVVDKLRAQRAALIGEAGAGHDPRAQLQSLIAGPSFDRNKAQLLVQSKTTALQTGSPEVIAALADFFDSLRPEQQAKVREILARGKRRS